MIRYVHIPKNNAFYRAQEDCCFETVSYDENNLGITSKMDKSDDKLNSWDLLCNCHPNEEMQEISEDEYKSKRSEVMKELTRRSEETI